MEPFASINNKWKYKLIDFEWKAEAVGDRNPLSNGLMMGALGDFAIDAASMMRWVETHLLHSLRGMSNRHKSDLIDIIFRKSHKTSSRRRQKRHNDRVGT